MGKGSFVGEETLQLFYDRVVLALRTLIFGWHFDVILILLLLLLILFLALENLL